VKYIGLLSSAASGKLGGIVASHNRGGQYFRHHSIPTQPRTPAQRAVRNQLAGFSSAFKALSAANVAGWNALGATVTLKSKLGTTYHPTGQQLFVSCNKHLAEIGITTMISTAPSVPTIPAITGFTVTNVGTISSPATVSSMAWSASGASQANFGLVAKATSVMSTGRTFAGKSLYRLIGYANPASGMAADFYTMYTNKFGALPQSGIISFELALIDPASGFKGAVVTANFQFYQPVGTNLFSITAANKTLSITTGDVTLTPNLTDNTNNGVTFAGAINWSLNNLPANVTYTISANPSATAPTFTISKGSTSPTIGVYSCEVLGTYGSFEASAGFTLTVTA
jgi:hypothetical protein